MNSLVVLPEEVRDGSHAVLVGGRARYALDTHGVREGESLKIAVMNGMRGHGRIVSASTHEVVIALDLGEPRLDHLPVSLIVGVSRPQTVKKVIQAAVMFGVSSLHFVRSEKGEKSYLQSRSLNADQIEEEKIKALEQIWDSRPPEIVVHRAFSYFMTEKFPSVVNATRDAGDGHEVLRVVAHPGGASLTCSDAPRVRDSGAIIAIGPERGWSDGEVQLFEQSGFEKIGLGQRVVRVELALVFLLGQLAILRSSERASA